MDRVLNFNSVKKKKKPSFPLWVELFGFYNKILPNSDFIKICSCTVFFKSFIVLPFTFWSSSHWELIFWWMILLSFQSQVLQPPINFPRPQSPYNKSSFSFRYPASVSPAFNQELWLIKWTTALAPIPGILPLNPSPALCPVTWCGRVFVWALDYAQRLPYSMILCLTQQTTSYFRTSCWTGSTSSCPTAQLPYELKIIFQLFSR